MANDDKKTHPEPSRLNRIPHTEHHALFDVASVKQLPLLSAVVVIESVLGVQYTLHNWKYLLVTAPLILDPGRASMRQRYQVTGVYRYALGCPTFTPSSSERRCSGDPVDPEIQIANTLVE